MTTLHSKLDAAYWEYKDVGPLYIGNQTLWHQGARVALEILLKEAKEHESFDGDIKLYRLVKIVAELLGEK